MAECRYCGLEMLTANGCTAEAIMIEGVSYDPVRLGTEPGWRRFKGRCPDCAALPGNVHHHGCDVERCPRCRRQSISCDCLWAGEEHLSEDWLEEIEERIAMTPSLSGDGRRLCAAHERREHPGPAGPRGQ